MYDKKQKEYRLGDIFIKVGLQKNRNKANLPIRYGIR